ncbi:MAG: DUF4382 domain-containing protein [Gemmatimonadales bacterium]
MPRSPRLLTLSLAVLGVVAGAFACYEDDLGGPDTGNGKPIAKVLVTDAPFPFDTVQSVNMYIVSVAASTAADTSAPGGQQWVTIAEPRRRVDLIALQQGATTLVGEGELDAAQYRAVRVIVDVDQSDIRYKDGSLAVVHWGGGGEQAIHAFVEQALAVPEAGAGTGAGIEADTAAIVIDFDVGRSFHYNDFGDGSFTFLPWIRAVDRAATGSIAGNILSGTTPVENATVSAYGASEGTWQIRSTGMSDTAGHYRIAYLLPGTYIVAVEPPSGSGLGSDLDSNVVVTAGVETQHSLSLGAYEGAVYIAGASSMLVNRTNELEAVVVDAQQQRVPNPVVDWNNLDPETLQLEHSGGQFASVTSLAVGQGRVVATSGDLSDTLLITVAADTSQPSARPRRP